MKALKSTKRFIFSLILLTILAPKGYAENDQVPGDEEWTPYEGHLIRFQKTYHLFLYPAMYKLPPEKKYIRNIFSTMMFDQLRLASTVYVADPYPVEIRYNEKLDKEDPQEDFLKKYIPRPTRFPLNVLPAAKFPDKIRQPEKLIVDGKMASALSPENIHAVSFAEKSGDGYRFRIYLIRNGKVLCEKELLTKEEDISRNLYVFFQSIAVFLDQTDTGSVRITASEPKSSVYVDERFAGFAPVEIPNIMPGVHKIIVRKNGFKPWEHTVTVQVGDRISLAAEFSPYENLSRITVTSNVGGADVYVGVEHVGRTPLELTGILPGNRRIHIKKEGFIDYYHTVRVAEGENTYTVHGNLKEGDTIDHYTPGGPVFLGMSYNKLFNTSAYITLGTGLIGTFFLVEKERALNAVSSYETYAATTGADYASYFDVLNRNAELVQGFETGFFVAAGFFLATTIYFYIRFIDEQDIPIVFSPPLATEKRAQLNLDLSPETLSFTLRKYF